MKIHFVSGRGHDSNIYVITGETLSIVDTGTGLYSDYVIDDIKKIADPKLIKQIILTHEHFDHCGGLKKLFETTGGDAKIMAHKFASDHIEKGESMFAKMLGGVMPHMPVDVKLDDGDTVVLGDETFKVFHTPGHTPGCLCLYSEDSKSLISGDTVFSQGWFGRYDFPGGSLTELQQSIKQLASLDVVNLYPGHESIVEGDGAEHMAMTLRNVNSLM